MKSFEDFKENELEHFNDDLARLVAKTYNGVKAISEKHNVKMEDTAEQFIGSCAMLFAKKSREE